MRRVLSCLFALLLLAPISSLRAQEAWLVTYGPGQEVWELFGHNAIWIRDEERGLDHSFSFGYFELGRDGFYRDFARGIMPYYGAATRIDREFEFYRERGRSIRVQRLNLDEARIAALYDRLHESIFPQPQYYPYDYYLANCSTWLRDLLDEVTNGALREPLSSRPAVRNFRDHTRAMTSHRFWLHTGIMTLLGPAVDRPITVWDEAFLPVRLADSLVGLPYGEGALVLEDRVLLDADPINDRPNEPSVWPISLGLGLLSLGLLMWPAMAQRRQRLAALTRTLAALAAGAAGLVLAMMWIGSGHEATWRNAMLLVLNPFWLLLLLPLKDRPYRILAWSLMCLALLGAIYLVIPIGQFRLDQMLWYGPLTLGLGLSALQRRSEVSSKSR
ncbi:lipoprotein N-acyltransferase Lnb domain-containing protein [Wenzhouxiangella marina]|uniref:lipoprotein N-acyltransferase Lnb domain-containing protein n=1 Tax=Wenzhouxiangella marina TaxID=1579979 RepID=UPI0006731E3A|nr:DUF4105 domain-containing protein [Wenzhouxiangella marina]MBB6086386.1 hypothetical protein [Wenzhouxiangella marina]